MTLETLEKASIIKEIIERLNMDDRLLKNGIDKEEFYITIRRDLFAGSILSDYMRATEKKLAELHSQLEAL